MNIKKLLNIDKLYFNANDIAALLSIDYKSAQVTASRYVTRNILVRLKRDCYILPQRMKNSSETELFQLANILQTPSYVSLTSALSYYNITTQQTRNYLESVCLKRTNLFKTYDIEFAYSKINKVFYFGFQKVENFFIAFPEKALADSIYLTAIGRYKADFDAIDFQKINCDKVSSIIKNSNAAVKNLWQKLMKNYNL
ncbi:MAG: hypothetical protein AB1432_13860 [Bacteroidota bacterium]